MLSNEKIIQLRHEINVQLFSLINDDYVYLDLPYYKNIGDTLIWEGTRCFLKQTPYKCLYSASLSTFYNHKFSEEVVILLQGGGNFGDLYIDIHNFRKKIIEQYPNNKIIIFPQTAWYKETESIEKDEIFFARFPNVTMCARDDFSYAFMRKHFPANKVLLVPDMAFFVDFEKYGHLSCAQTGRILFAKRLDWELKTDSIPRVVPQNADICDWPTFEAGVTKYAQVDYIVGWLNFFANIKGIKPINRLIDLIRLHFYRPEYIKDCFRFINQYDVIYSTRLHIAIASAMMGKKVFIVDNLYGKNVNFYKTWLNDMENVKIISD